MKRARSLLRSSKEKPVMKTQKKRFKWRGVTTFMLILASVVEIISGVVLYITPLGRFANWTNWTLLGLNKHEWVAIHTIFGYLLLIIIAGHLYYNWRVIVAFLWSRMRKAFNLKRELAVASLISLFVFLGTFWGLPPFSTVMDFGYKMKLSWEGNAVQSGRWEGNRATSTSVLSTLEKGNETKGWRRNNDLPPGVAHAETSPDTERVFPAERGGDFGRKTLEMICSENGVPVKEGLSRLRNQGIEASATDRIRDLANRSGKRPSEIIQVITGGTGTYLGSAHSQLDRHSEVIARADNRAGSKKGKAATLKGRDLVRLGKIATVTGTLFQHGDEWGLKVGDTLYEIHLGPAEYRAQKGFTLKEGDQATIKGFVYNTDVAVTTIETGGKSIVLRDETGRPAWARTTFSSAGRARNL